MQNRIARFWLRPPADMPLDEAFIAADGETIHKATGGLITALASSDGTEFLFTGEDIHPCPPGADARKHLARELRRLAYRCALAVRTLEGRDK